MKAKAKALESWKSKARKEETKPTGKTHVSQLARDTEKDSHKHLQKRKESGIYTERDREIIGTNRLMKRKSTAMLRSLVNKK